MTQIKHQHWSSRLGGYLLIPHELLHIAGFRLAGKRCKYQWGNPHVTPIGPMTRWERLVGKLFPFAVFATLVIIFTILSTFAYSRALQGGSFFWFIVWTGLTLIAGIYVGTATVDLRSAYLLIFDKPWYSWTPFDIFFWPPVDWPEIRKNLASKENHDQES